jgi:hypothetical protein
VDYECGYDDRPPDDSGRIEGVHRNKWPGSFDPAPPENRRAASQASWVSARSSLGLRLQDRVQVDTVETG